jgi:hypothetical protein
MCLLGLSYRFGKNENFPADVSKSIEECVLNFPFTQDTLDEYDESEQIKFHTCKILAGQKFARRIFPLSKLKGKQLFEQGVKDSIAWLLEKGRYGLKAWDSDEHLAQIIVALTHLIDLAEDESVFNLAAVLLDKILVGIAINAHQGVLASACGQGTSLGVNSALTKATAGISRIFWGHGIFNHHTSGYVSVACMTNYELPSIIGDIATSKEELLGWEKHAETSKVTYRTVEFMLSSAVGYKTGERGSREHIWQATLGPEAIVYVNHPGNSAWDDAITPNYWLGNVVLPHLAQHKDALIAMYNLPPDDWMGFTHAYFPTFSFDEYVLKKNWAFARKGESYLAITASGKVNFFESGAGAYRELRCTGQKPIWVCQLGSAALDGNFTTFVQKVSELNLVFHGLAVEYNTLRGDKLQLTWDGKLSINDKEQANEDQFHYNYPFLKAEYPCHKMEIEYNGYILRLDFHPNGD